MIQKRHLVSNLEEFIKEQKPYFRSSKSYPSDDMIASTFSLDGTKLMLSSNFPFANVADFLSNQIRYNDWYRIVNDAVTPANRYRRYLRELVEVPQAEVNFDESNKLAYALLSNLMESIDMTKTLNECDQKVEFTNFVLKIDYVGKGDIIEAYRRHRGHQENLHNLIENCHISVAIIFPFLTNVMSLNTEQKSIGHSSMIRALVNDKIKYETRHCRLKLWRP